MSSDVVKKLLAQFESETANMLRHLKRASRCGHAREAHLAEINKAVAEGAALSPEQVAELNSKAAEHFEMMKAFEPFLVKDR